MIHKSLPGGGTCRRPRYWAACEVGDMHSECNHVTTTDVAHMTKQVGLFNAELCLEGELARNKPLLSGISSAFDATAPSHRHISRSLLLFRCISHSLPVPCDIWLGVNFPLHPATPQLSLTKFRTSQRRPTTAIYAWKKIKNYDVLQRDYIRALT